MSWLCALGWHRWQYSPDRQERRCTRCLLAQVRSRLLFSSTWVTFDDSPDKGA
jgi:hypothetical protein